MAAQDDAASGEEAASADRSKSADGAAPLSAELELSLEERLDAEREAGGAALADDGAIDADDPDAEAREQFAAEFAAAWVANMAANPDTPWKLAQHFEGELAAVNEAAVAAASAKARAEVEAALAAVSAGGWPTLDDCIPPGSLLQELDEAFIDTSDIPREIPLFAALHYISALMSQQEACLRTMGGRKRLDLWTIVLAPSGAGKSYALNEIRKAFGDGIDIFPKPDSERHFVESLAEHNMGLFPIDEFAQFVGEMGKGGRLAKVRDYLLKCGEGGVVEYNTMATQLRIENPGLTIFGATVVDTFKKYFGADSIKDGLAQRMAFVFAERDPARPKLADYSFENERSGPIGKSWRALLASVDPSRTCFMPRPAAAAYQRAFEILLARAEQVDVDEGYSRRLAARGQKYAMVYHFLLGKASLVIDAEDLGYGMRVAALHLKDTRRLLDLFAAGSPAAPGASSPEREREQALAAVAACLGRARDAGAAPVDARKLLQLVKRVKGGELARELMREAVEADPSLAPFASIAPPKPGAIGRRADPAGN